MDTASDRISLWCVTIRHVDESCLGRCTRLLSEAERHRESQFRSACDQRRYRITRAAVRIILSRYAGVPPDRLVFATSAFGKPCLTGWSADRGLSFNISHTDRLIIVGVTQARRLGVVVERVRPEFAWEELAETVLTGTERAAMASHPTADCPTRFIELWTLKEALLKAHGLGLTRAMTSVGFRLPGQHGIMLETAMAESLQSEWIFWQYGIDDDHIAALCTDGGTIVPEICMREFTPFGAEREISPLLRRISERAMPQEF